MKHDNMGIIGFCKHCIYKQYQGILLVNSQSE